MNRDTEQTCRTEEGLLAIRTGKWPSGFFIELQAGSHREFMRSHQARVLAYQLSAAADALDAAEGVKV